MVDGGLSSAGVPGRYKIKNRSVKFEIAGHGHRGTMDDGRETTSISSIVFSRLSSFQLAFWGSVLILGV
jgi:hypothetical protein